MHSIIGIESFRSLYESEIEFAVIDPREEMLFARGHLFAATNMPLSKIELLAISSIPKKSTLIVLCDDDSGVAERAISTLVMLGYSNLKKLEGGLPFWQLQGGAVFSGVNVPSKSFGEVVEKELQTPRITSKELYSKISNKDDFLLLDARPLEEHVDYCIPGSISCPSSEMLLRVLSLDLEPDKEIIVHCAGRTRAIIGAQTLVDSGQFKSVRALENGTPGWEFEGYSLVRGDVEQIALPERLTDSSARLSKEILEKWNIEKLDQKSLQNWISGEGTRYLLDVRSIEEFKIGHLHGSTHAPGGQLIQTTERHLPVRNAHVTLIDSDGIRAVTTAVWLRRMGWKKVSVYQITDDELIEGVASQFVIDEDEWITAEEIIKHQTSGDDLVICDLRASYQYRRNHILGSAFLTRENLADDIEAVNEKKLIVLLVDNLDYGAITLRDLHKLGRTAKLLRGGIASWVENGLPMDNKSQWMLSRPVDCYLDPEHFDDLQLRIRENHAYLNWEIALIDHIVGEPAAQFELDA